MSRVLITGSSAGLGLMAGQLLAGEGHAVTLHARNEARAADARSALLSNAIQPMVDAMRKGDHATADRLAMAGVPPLAAALTQKTATLDKFRNEQGATRYQSAQDRYNTLLAFTLLAIALGLIACVTSGFLVG